MSEVKRFHLREGTLVEGKSVGCLNVYLSSDYDQLEEKLWHSEMAAEAEAHRVDELKLERDELRRRLGRANTLLSRVMEEGDIDHVLGQTLVEKITEWLKEAK